jgi:hypothetical protein
MEKCVERSLAELGSILSRAWFIFLIRLCIFSHFLLLLVCRCVDFIINSKIFGLELIWVN